MGTIAKQIEADLKAELAEIGRTITDPKELAAWMSDNGIGRSAMSAATGADYQAVTDKQRAGNPHRKTGAATYAALSRPLTADNFPGTPASWRDWKPTDAIAERLSAALEDVVLVLYADILGRWPDIAGRNHYEGQLAAGRSRWEIVREIELSDEARAE